MLIHAIRRRGLRAPRWLGITLGVFAALALAAGVALAQAARPYGFVYLVGGDTLGVERVTAAGNLLTGDLQMRGQARMQWTVTLAGPGHTRGVVLTAWQSAAADAPMLQRAVIDLDGDTARAEITAGAAPPRKQAIATRRDAFLLVNASAALVDQLLARARAMPSSVDTIPIFLTTGGRTMDGYVRVGTDSATVTIAGQETRVSLDPRGNVREAAVGAQNLRMVRIEGAAYESLRIGGPDYSAPPGAPYTAESVTIPATGGHTLAGTLTRPAAAAGRLAVVVTITGSGPQDRDEYIPLVPGFRPFRQLADTLGRRGVAVLRYDDRGTGGSTGSFTQATSADFAEDVRSAVRWLRTRPDVDPRRVFLAGHSEGGLIAPMVAATDSTLAGIVLLAGPAQSGRDILRFQQRYAVEHDTTFRDPARRDSALRVSDSATVAMAKGNPWMGFFLTHDPLATARRVKVPALVAQGATDQQVTADQAEPLGAALRASGNRDVTVRVFPGRNHLFLEDATGNPATYVRLTSGRIGADVMGPIVDWILERANR